MIAYRSDGKQLLILSDLHAKIYDQCHKCQSIGQNINLIDTNNLAWFNRLGAESILIPKDGTVRE